MTGERDADAATDHFVSRKKKLSVQLGWGAGGRRPHWGGAGS